MANNRINRYIGAIALGTVMMAGCRDHTYVVGHDQG